MKFAILFIAIFSFALNLPSSFEANFKQTITQEDKKLNYKGKVFVKEDKIFWHYIYPNEKQIWINDKLYMYEPDLMQVTITKRPKFNITNLIKEAKQISKNQYIIIKENKKFLITQDKNLTITYTDEVGNENKIIIYNIKPKELNSSLFTPKYPKDSDIIVQK